MFVILHVQGHIHILVKNGGRVVRFEGVRLRGKHVLLAVEPRPERYIFRDVLVFFVFGKLIEAAGVHSSLLK